MYNLTWAEAQQAMREGKRVKNKPLVVMLIIYHAAVAVVA